MKLCLSSEIARQVIQIENCLLEVIADAAMNEFNRSR
mgnify:CR=1 FL=1